MHVLEQEHPPKGGIGRHLEKFAVELAIEARVVLKALAHTSTHRLERCNHLVGIPKADDEPCTRADGRGRRQYPGHLTPSSQEAPRPHRLPALPSGTIGPLRIAAARGGPTARVSLPVVSTSSRSDANSSAGGSRIPSHGSMHVTTRGGWKRTAARSVVPVRGHPQMMKSSLPGPRRGGSSSLDRAVDHAGTVPSVAASETIAPRRRGRQGRTAGHDLPRK